LRCALFDLHAIVRSIKRGGENGGGGDNYGEAGKGGHGFSPVDLEMIRGPRFFPSQKYEKGA
jgi:hypothetical protein